jgi:hypothetical protein
MAKAPTTKAAPKAAAKPATKKAVVSNTDAEMLDGIFVRSLPDTFRRAGFTFTREGHGLLLANLTQEQLDAIEAEPLLSVTYAQFPATAEADAKLAELAKAQADAENVGGDAKGDENDPGAGGAGDTPPPPPPAS